MEREKSPEEIKYFNPCGFCSNFAKEQCFDDCVYIGDYRNFKLRPGTGVKDLPSFPADEIINDLNPRFRLIVISAYLEAITDYLQHEDEYEFREKSPEMEKKLPDNFKVKV